MQAMLAVAPFGRAPSPLITSATNDDPGRRREASALLPCHSESHRLATLTAGRKKQPSAIIESN
jgi:hypothetical protein